MADEYLTAKEVADKLRCSTHTVNRWLRTGKLKGVKAEGKWLVHRKDFNEYLERSSNK